jgi:hypothetical protein
MDRNLSHNKHKLIKCNPTDLFVLKTSEIKEDVQDEDEDVLSHILLFTFILLPTSNCPCIDRS